MFFVVENIVLIKDNFVFGFKLIVGLLSIIIDVFCIRVLVKVIFCFFLLENCFFILCIFVCNLFGREVICEVNCVFFKVFYIFLFVVFGLLICILFLIVVLNKCGFWFNIEIYLDKRFVWVCLLFNIIWLFIGFNVFVNNFSKVDFFVLFFFKIVIFFFVFICNDIFFNIILLLFG